MDRAPNTQYIDVDGSSVAFQVVGDGSFDLLLTAGSFNHVDGWWDDPTTARFLRRLSSFSRLILFDRRGTGASDPLPSRALPSWENWMEDFKAVTAAAGSDRCSVLASLDGCPVAMLYAATYPERLRSLVLFNSTARYRHAPDYPEGLPDEEVEARIEWVSAHWGTEEFSARNYPDRSSDQGFLRWYAKYQRSSVPPALIGPLVRQWWSIDARDIVPSVITSTVVLHRRDYHFVPIRQAQWLADHLPHASMVELPGTGSMIGTDVDNTVDVIEFHLTNERPQLQLDRAFSVVLFTDIVDSTGHLVRLGDRAWRRLLESHDRAAKVAVESCRGSIIKSTGDGVLARFDGSGVAVQAAEELISATADLGVRVRTAIHAGEVEIRDDGDIGGLAVHVAARLLNAAGPDHIVLSDAAFQLLPVRSRRVTKLEGLTLRGVPGTWTVHLIEPSATNR